MTNQRWRMRWKQNDIAFHQTDVHPLLPLHWHHLNLPQTATVLVPMCGKSLDMQWLLDAGHRVIGIELSHIAIQDCFHALNVTPSRHRHGRFIRWQHGRLELWCGDLFDLRREDLGDIAAVYDCAALTALPAASRGHYVRQLSSLLAVGGQMLLLTTESADEPAAMAAADLAEVAPAPTAQADAGPADAEHSPDPEVLALYQSRFAIALWFGHTCLKVDPEYPSLPASLLAEKVYHLGPRV